jgi:hypothetical protein
MAKKKPKTVIDADVTEKQRYIDYVLAGKKEAEEASKDRRNKWGELWNLYQNKQDYSAKMSWQSRCVMPKLFTQVEKSSAEIKRAVLQSSKLFSFDLADDSLQSRINQLTDLISQTGAVNAPEAFNQARNVLLTLQKLRKKQLTQKDSDEKKFKKEFAKTNFASAYSEMIKSAFLLGLGIPKIIWNADKKCVTYENVNALNLFVSPDYEPSIHERPPYVVEYKEMNLSTLKKAAKKTNEVTKVYDMEEIDKIEEDWRKENQKIKERAQKGIKQFTPVSKKVGILEFWGDIINPEDDSIEENLLMVIANEKYLIRKQENPFNHKKPPYHLTIPLPYPHRGWSGISLVEAMVLPNYTYNNIFNMFVDNLNFIVNKMYEYNPTLLMPGQDVSTVYPGKMVKKNVNEQVLQEIITSSSGIVPLIKALEVLGKEMQEGTFVTEFLMGTPGKPKTLGEVEIKTAESRGIFDVIARDLEENSIKPILEMTYDLYVQFGEGWPARENKYLFSVGGLSLLLMQREMVERASQILLGALKYPELGQMTDIDDLYRKLLSIFNLAEVYKEPNVSLAASGQLTPEQKQNVEQRAAADAKRDVSQMSPEQITSLAPASQPVTAGAQ